MQALYFVQAFYFMQAFCLCNYSRYVYAIHLSPSRIDAYWAQKAKLIAQGVIPDDKGRWRRPSGIDDNESADNESTTCRPFM